jgi:hypothetical protein
MAEIKGTLVTDRISPGDTRATFPTHEDIYGQGGLRTVTTYNDLLTGISIERQKEGMLVFVKNENKYYALSSISAPLTSVTSHFYVGFSDYLTLSGGTVRGDVTFLENISAGKIIYTSQYGSSVEWDSTHTSVYNTSANWDSVYSSVSSTSANWDSVYSSVNNTSGNWDSVYSSVSSTSANWDSVYSSVYNTSANWDSVYSSVSSTSANWDSVYSSVSSTSANWDSVYSSVSSTSANWDSVYTSVKDTSGSWNSTYSTVSSLSSDWSAWRSMALSQDMSQFQTATEKTSGGNVIGYLRDGTPATLPANTPYPLYRLSTPNASPREYTDLAVVRGNFNNTVPYFTGNIRGQVDFQRPIEVYIRVASPIAGTGIFQFGLGYGFNLNLGSLTVGNDFPDFPDTGIGFRLGRAQGPGISSLSAALITKPTGGVTGAVEVINSTSSLTIPITTANYFLLRYLPTGYLGLYLIKNGNENLLVEHNHGTTYTLQTSSHNVNWFAGINPKDTIGGMTYDIEPPKILYSI